MKRVVVSPKFQVVIPKEIRKMIALQKGQKMIVMVKGGMIILAPQSSIKRYRGFLGKMDTKGVRDKRDRS